MTLVRLYLYREKLVLPTVKQTEAGFYVDSEPVHVQALNEKQSLLLQLIKTLGAANQVIPTPTEHQEAGSVILDRLGLQRWSSFEKSAVMYMILKGVRYTTIYASGRGEDGMWSESTSRQRSFHPDLSLQRVAELLVEDMNSQPEARSERFSLALLAKPHH